MTVETELESIKINKRMGLFHQWTHHWVLLLRRFGEALSPWPRWLGLAVCLGVLPVLGDFAFGVLISHGLTALLGWPLLLVAVAQDRSHPALKCLITIVVLHCVTVIALAASYPEQLAIAHPAGWDYWQETERWLRTGESEKYDIGWWAPVHLQLIGVMLVWCYLSLGLIPLLQGLYELDLMNFYVGQLLAHSQGLTPALIFAWHPWSLCRGVGFLFLTYETASWALQHLTGISLSSGRHRLRRVVFSLGFLFLDATIKWTSSESVRQILSQQLVQHMPP